ncbi:MAG: histidine kinase [Colwellia sp.]|nr:histidine kinase [Colwellia sp.]
MSEPDVYKAAYFREIKARQLAEKMLEDKTRDLSDRVLHLEGVVSGFETMQGQLIQSEKMASLGQLTAGIAHEINNPIAYTYSNLVCLTENILEIFKLDKIIQDSDLENDDARVVLNKYQSMRQQIDAEYLIADTPSLLIDSIDGIERVKTIVNNLKKISYKGDDTFITCNINECIDDCLKLVVNELKYSMAIKLELTDCDNILGQPYDLNQVFINLFINASHACKSKGILTIKTVQENGNVIINITDNGKGISEENILKIFDPFYTTKVVGEGTGLGLPISHGIISKHNGKIEVHSKVNVGTCFTITLPLA